MAFPVPDLRDDPAAWASRLRISREAVELYAACDVVDLHVESYLWTRMIGYDLTRRHGLGPGLGLLGSQADLPRLVEAGVAGVQLSIATWPFGRRAARTKALHDNVAELRAIVRAHADELALVHDHASWQRARAGGKLCVMLAIQGGNALDSGETDVLSAPEELLRVTLVHLTGSTVGGTSSPLGGERGLTPFGWSYVRQLDERRILVDLAHASKTAFWDAVSAHDPARPLVVTHTGVEGVTKHWRNLDDEQLQAIAATGGLVGIMFQSTFLGDGLFSGRAASVVAHLEHVVKVCGEDVAAIGSDFDGMIVPPRDLRDVTELPVLVQRMLDRGFPEARIRKILGGNFLRVLRELRPGVAA